jgi:hypothetical protein
MSRYAGSPRWFLLVKAGMLGAFLPAMLYITLCNSLALHYRAKLDYYDDAGLHISDGWLYGQDFNDHSVCVSQRYLSAGAAAIDHGPFDAWWMIRNWNTDFLAQQPICK